MQSQAEELETLLAHLEELAEDYDEDHTADFLTYIQHPESLVRAAAIRGLWESDPAEVLDQVLAAASSDPDEEVRSTAISVLGRIVYEGLIMDSVDSEGGGASVTPDSVQRVRQFLEGILYSTESSELLRRRALEALSFDLGPEEVELIEKWSVSREPTLRMTALFAMGRSGLEQWEGQLLKSLKDADFEVRREAIRAIGEAAPAAGVSALEPFVRGTDRELKLEAIAAMGQLGGPAAVEILIDLAQSEDEEIAELAQMAIEAAEEFSDDDFDDDEPMA